MGGAFSTGPREAAFVVNDLVNANAAIASHANEAATKDGKLLPNSKTAAFKAASKAAVYPSLSGKTMEFDAEGRCAGGC
jgi:hypothetical protein